MASKLNLLKSKACQATQFVSKHGSSYYKKVLEENKQYIVDPPTVQTCQELSKKLFYTRLARYIMANPTEIGWNYGTAIDGNLRKTKCNFCNKIINGGGVTRLKEHLAGVGGDVSACLIVPKEVKQLIRSHIIQKRNERIKGKLDKQRLQEELMSRPQQLSDNENEDDEELQRVMRQSRDAFRDEELRRSHTVGRSGGGSSQTERNVRGKSTRIEGDFDAHAIGRIDSYMQKRGAFPVGERHFGKK